MIRIETKTNEAGSIEYVITDETEEPKLFASARVVPGLPSMRDAVAHEIHGALDLLTAVRMGRPYVSAKTVYRGHTRRILAVKDLYGVLHVTLDDGIGIVPWSECTYEGF